MHFLENLQYLNKAYMAFVWHSSRVLYSILSSCYCQCEISVCFRDHVTFLGVIGFLPPPKNIAAFGFTILPCE